MVRLGRLAFALALFAATAQAVTAAETVRSPSGFVELRSRLSFDGLLARLEQAVKGNGMAIVAQASASRGATARGITIAGNAVIMVFRNDYAVRMLEASIPAGIEAPLRFYVTENPDKTTVLRYRAPSTVFAPYGSPALDAMARELDVIFDKIARDAAGN